MLERFDRDAVDGKLPLSLKYPCGSRSNPLKATTSRGISKAFLGKVKSNANYFRRVVNNYADDDQIENTTISFPIAFRKAIIYGAEGKIEVPSGHRFSGFLSYSYEVGNAWNHVTGELFLGDDATQAEEQLTGHLQI
jgi:hypothetical protein